MPKNEDYAVGSMDTDKNPASHVVDELRRSFKPPGAGPPTTPAEKIEDALSQVQNAVREQQMCTEQNLQNCLSKASTHVADSQAIDTLFAISQQVASLVSQGNESLRANAPQVREMIAQLGAQLAMQQAKSDRQVAMALQQAVASMSDAQSAMFQSMSLSEMQQLVRGVNQVVKDVLSPGQVQ
jgi:cysteinyl-tRNA synthetase